MAKLKGIRKVDGISIKNTLAETKLTYRANKAGKIIPTHIQTSSVFHTKMRLLWNSILSWMLLRIRIELLDAAIKRKTGKPHPRGAVSRARAKGINEGFQLAIKRYQDQWFK